MTKYVKRISIVCTLCTDPYYVLSRYVADDVCIPTKQRRYNVNAGISTLFFFLQMGTRV